MNESFHTRARKYIDGLIRMRSYLNKYHLTRADVLYQEMNITFLKKHLTLNGYHSDKQMAGFWMRHHDKIFNMIPGIHCASSAALTRSFDELKTEAGRIFSQSMITPDITHSNQIIVIIQ